MLTPWYIRFIFLWLIAIGIGSLYVACSSSLAIEYQILAGVVSAFSLIIGMLKMRVWYHAEIVAQRGASMLIQAKTATAAEIHSEIKQALESKKFIEALKNGLNTSKWSIHNDTSLKNAQLRVEFNFPEEWLKKSSLWCALGIIAGALPENYSWGTSGRDKTKIVLTVVTPDGTTNSARNAANEWVHTLNLAIHSNYSITKIEESYIQADVPTLKSKTTKKLTTEEVLINPPNVPWNVFIQLRQENYILQIGNNIEANNYYVLISSSINSRRDEYNNWTDIMKLWGKLPEVKLALYDKFSTM